MAVIIKINGDTETIEPENGKMFSLEELQQAVGGYTQVISIRNGEYAGKLMVVDEEGLLKPEPQVNIKASLVVGQRIVGQVAVIEKHEIE